MRSTAPEGARELGEYRGWRLSALPDAAGIRLLARQGESSIVLVASSPLTEADAVRRLTAAVDRHGNTLPPV